MGLSNLLASRLENSKGDDQGPWRQFVLDHLGYIKRGSVEYSITEPLLNLYRYDLDRFLKEHLSRKEDIAWIVQLLNGLPNDLTFDKADNLFIPSDDLVTKLYSSYVTIVNNQF